MRHRILLGILLFCIGLLATVQGAKADTMDGVTFTVTNPNLSGSPGDALTWMYSLANNNPDGLDVLFVALITPSGFDVSDGSPLNTFDSFGGTDVVTNGANVVDGTLFSFQSFTTVPNSTNTGLFDLTLILQDSNGNPVGLPFDLTEKYSATITSSTSIPEPGTLLLLACGLMAGFLFLRGATR
jgi:hypothetical protein